MDEFVNYFMHSGQRFSIEHSNLFKLHELEKNEIEKFRWIRSEQEKCDIGEFRANWEWWAYRRDNWLRGLRESGLI